MKLAQLGLVMVVTLAAMAANGEKRYSMKDLEALVKSESWLQLVEHLDDVAPSERDGRWQQVVEMSAVGFLDTRRIGLRLVTGSS